MPSLRFPFLALVFAGANACWSLSESEAVLAGLTKNFDIRILENGRSLDSLDIRRLRGQWLPSAGVSGTFEKRLSDSTRVTTPLGNLGASDESGKRALDAHFGQFLP